MIFFIETKDNYSSLLFIIIIQ